MCLKRVLLLDSLLSEENTLILKQTPSIVVLLIPTLCQKLAFMIIKFINLFQYVIYYHLSSFLEIRERPQKRGLKA
jgi:hypothetical protein